MQRVVNATRHFSSQVRLVRPPIGMFGLEGSYTNAIYSAAAKNNCLDAVESDLKKLDLTIQNDRTFREFMYNPLVNVNQKKEILKQILTSKLGANELTVNLVQVMTENRRLKHLSGVSQKFFRIMQVTRGEMSCVVTTASPVTDEAVKKEIVNALKGFTKNKLSVTMQVDPTILGGMVVDFNGEHYIDMSVRSKVKTYSELIQQAV